MSDTPAEPAKSPEATPPKKVRPPQIRTNALVAGSAIAAATPSAMAMRTAWLSAFTGGESIVRTATPS